MKKEDGLSSIALILLIAIIILTIGMVIHFSVGEDGVITKATLDEEEFDMEEVLDELNFAITEKYLGTYKNEVVNGKKIEEVYNQEIVINYLKEKNILENYSNKENVFYINVAALNTDIKQGRGENGSDKDVYIVERINTSGEYIVSYIKSKDEKNFIGNLIFEQEL